jgi:hypothetical protein
MVRNAILLTLAGLAQAQHTESGVLLDPLGSSGDGFGWQIAVDGDCVAISATGSDQGAADAGAVSLFDLASGQQRVRLTAPNAGTHDQFGFAVALGGGLVAVGAHGRDALAEDSGSVYVFDETTQQLVFELTASDGERDDGFGYALALHGNQLLVGAPGDDDLGSGAGAVYAYDLTTGQELLKLTAAGGGPGGAFGSSLDADAGRLLVGTSYSSGYGQTAYVFDLATFTQGAVLTSPNGPNGDDFASSVALEGNLAVVGAPRDDEAGSDAGAVHLFDATSGVHLVKLLAQGAAAGAELGTAVAVEGGRVLAGAPRGGYAYLFDAGTGQQLAELGSGDFFGSFGAGVALAGRTVLVGDTQAGTTGEVIHYDLGRRPQVHALVVGVHDDAIGGRGSRGGLSATRVFGGLQEHPWTGVTQLLTFSYADGGAASWAKVQEQVARFTGPAGPIEEGDLFLFYLAGHGSQEAELAPGDEAAVLHQVDPLNPGVRVSNTQDEVFHFDAGFTVSDDELRTVFAGPEWAAIDKLFVLDFCFSGGFWGDTGAGDSGDLATLPRSALLAASSEADFAWSIGSSDAPLAWGVGYLSRAFRKGLADLGVAFDAHHLTTAVNVRHDLWSAEPITGYVMAANDYSGWYGQEARADLGVFAAATPDFDGLVGAYEVDRDVGYTYCYGSIDANDAAIQMRAIGDDRAAANDLLLVGEKLPPGEIGMPLVSSTPNTVDGGLCLGGAVGRCVDQLRTVEPGGRLITRVDLTALPIGSVQPGETLYFQQWYRDGAGSGHTTALGLTFR